MKVHITNLYGMAYNSVAQISQQMVARIGVENFNFNELGIYSYYDANESEEALSSRYDGILASVGANDVIIFTDLEHQWMGGRLIQPHLCLRERQADHFYSRRYPINVWKQLLFVRPVHWYV